VVADELCEPLFNHEVFAPSKRGGWHGPVLRNYWEEGVLGGQKHAKVTAVNNGLSCKKFCLQR